MSAVPSDGFLADRSIAPDVTPPRSVVDLESVTYSTELNLRTDSNQSATVAILFRAKNALTGWGHIDEVIRSESHKCGIWGEVFQSPHRKGGDGQVSK